MTKQEKINKLSTLKAQMEEKNIAYNEAIGEETTNFADIQKLDDDTKALEKEYLRYAREVCFDECAEGEDPMMEAVKKLSFKTLKSKDKQGKDDPLPTRVLEEREVEIDLMALHKYVKGGIGVNKDWHYMAEQLNLLLVIRAAKTLGIGTPAQLNLLNNSYAMSEAARKIKLGVNVASKNKTLACLNEVVQAMVGDGYKASSHDIGFLDMVWSRKSRKALTIQASNHRQLRGALLQICHKIVADKSYALDYDKVK